MRIGGASLHHTGSEPEDFTARYLAGALERIRKPVTVAVIPGYVSGNVIAPDVWIVRATDGRGCFGPIYLDRTAALAAYFAACDRIEPVAVIPATEAGSPPAAADATPDASAAPILRTSDLPACGTAAEAL
jgi:hypothetical protein